MTDTGPGAYALKETTPCVSITSRNPTPEKPPPGFSVPANGHTIHWSKVERGLLGLYPLGTLHIPFEITSFIALQNVTSFPSPL